MEYKYLGIILNKKDIGEADRIYTIYTLESGKIRVIAKGVRKSQAKLAGHLENFNLAHISVVKNRGMGKITGSIVENNFSQIKKDFEILGKVFSSIRVFNQLVREEEKDKTIFNLLLCYLESINNLGNLLHSQMDLLTQGFIFKLLGDSGYRVEVDSCTVCQGRISEGKNYFNSQQGGILCSRCSDKIQSKIPVSDNAIKIIRIFFKNKISSLQKLNVSEKEIGELEKISNDFLKWTAG